MDEVKGVITLAEGISSYGISIIMNAIFIIVIVFVLRWFKKLMDKTLDRNPKQMGELIGITQAQNILLDDIAEGIRPKTLLQVKDFSDVYFALTVEQVSNIVKKVRKENHLGDKAAVEEKVKLMLNNIHNERNSRFKNHTYRGRTLKDYTNDEWVDWAYKAAIKEIYRKTDNEDARRSTIKALCEKIKLDFDERLNK